MLHKPENAMLSCKDISENATNHLEGELSFSTRLQLRMHLLICKACRQFMRQFQTTVETARKLGDTEQSRLQPTDAEIDALAAKLSGADSTNP